MTSPQDIVSAIVTVGQAKTALDLSPPARAIMGALDSGVGAALGLGSSLSEASGEALKGLADEVLGAVSGTVADIIGEVGQVMPLIGPIIKAVAGIISMVLSLDSEAQRAQTCARFFSIYKPSQTGSMLSGGTTVPADIFALAHGVERWYTDNPAEYEEKRKSIPAGWVIPGVFEGRFIEGGPVVYRSALGMALMQITEGSIVDLRDIDWRMMFGALSKVTDDPHEKKALQSPRVTRALWRKAIERDAHIASLQWKRLQREKKINEPARGLPRPWRERFLRLRRGIEASWGPNLPAGASSDGGAALWIAYLDLLVRAFENGMLTWDYIEFLFRRQHRFATKGYAFTSDERHVWHRMVEPLLRRKPGRAYVEDEDLVAMPPTWIWGKDPCPRMVAQNIRALVEGWQRSVHPYYQQGQAKLAELEREARALGRSVGDGRRIRPRPRKASAAAVVEGGEQLAAAEGAGGGGEAPELDEGAGADWLPWLLGLGAMSAGGYLLWRAAESRR